MIITTKDDNRSVRIADENENETIIIPETQLSQDVGNVRVSTETNNFLYHSQGATHGRDNQN